MGFKRTSEGRVFFQNTGSNTAKTVNRDNQQMTATTKAPLTDNPAAKPNRVPYKKQDASQQQIIALLKTLNEKLGSTQADRKKLQQELETYKMMVMKLQEKSEAQEKESREIRQELSKKDDAALQKSKEAENLSREAFKEFEEARKLISEIEERSARTESLVKNQQVQVRQAEEQARIKWDDLKKKSRQDIEALLNRIDSAESSQKQLDARLEETISKTLKLDRKIEKTIQDRSRLLRKLERIEETVLQTHEAMNARAMVLLTDQATAEHSGYQHKPALAASAPAHHETEPPREEQFLDVPWWRKPMRMQAVSVSLIVLAAALGGWAISQVQKPEGLSFSLPDTMFENFNSAETAAVNSASTRVASIVPVQKEALVANDDAAETDLAENAQDDEAFEAFEAFETFDTASVSEMPVEEQMPAESEGLLEQPENPAVSEFDRIMEEQSVSEEAKNDIGAIDLKDEEQLVRLLDENPDALASALNEIEPSAIPEPAVDTVAALPKQRASIINLNEDFDLPTTLSGTLYERISADKNLPEPVKEIENAAFSGNAEAQHDLAAIYIAGHGGVKQDYKRASLWFEEAAHNGIANARYNLGVLYHQGIGVDKDIEKAFDWYRTAATLGHPEAQYNLGIAYIEGIGVPYDPQKAVAYFENSANAGVMEAAYNAGLIYENGLLGKAQPDTALMWYKRAADKGSPEAKSALEQLAKTLGLSLKDVNVLIEGMEVLHPAATAQKKTELDAGNFVALGDTPLSGIMDDGEVDLVSLVQEQLMALGLYPGPIDGQEGMITRDAVRAYQARNDLEVNGIIDESLLAHMQFQPIGLDEGPFEQGSREN
ncbi:MAG: peptidoglycan-binding protein [Alphaproteobacteria bacterium]